MIHYLERAHRDFEGNKFREVSLIVDLFISLFVSASGFRDIATFKNGQISLLDHGL